MPYRVAHFIVMNININRESGARESPPEERCSPPPGSPCGDQSRVHWQGSTASASAADQISALADCYRETLPGGHTYQFG